MGASENTVESDVRFERSHQVSLAERVHLRATLSKPLPEIPSHYFYDDRGSELFEQITHLPVYYPTRTELRILEHHAGQIIAAATQRSASRPRSVTSRRISLASVQAGAA